MSVASTASSSARDSVAARLSGAKRRPGELIFQAALLMALLASLAVLLALLASAIATAIPAFSSRGSSVITSGYSSLASRAGIWQGVIGSALLMLFVVFLAIPLGVGAAVYLSEYASDTRTTRIINANIRNLAGVPAIVYGILGLAIFVELLKPVTGPGSVQGKSLMAGGLTLALMVLPIVILISQEALRAVPSAIREGAYGVGATRWEVVRSHVLPNAAPGILTGCVLSIARALGETAPLLMVGAVTGFLSTRGTLFELFQQRFTSLPTLVYAFVTKPEPDFQHLAGVAIVVLMALIFLANLTAILLRNRYERKWR